MYRPLKSSARFLLAATLAWLAAANPCAWAQSPAQTPAQQKVGSGLLQASEADGRCKVRITADVSQALLDAVKAQGGEVLNSYPRHRAVYALVPLARLETLAARGDVEFIGPPPRVLHHRSAQATTAAVETATNDPEGDIAHGANQIRKQYNIDGTGIKVGVLSDSLDNGSGAYQAALNAGYVSAVTTIGQTVSGEGGGLAMLEIVHRLAPGAQLYFATGDVSEEDFADNIEALASAGCKIIIDDLSYSDESPFQDGIVAQAVNTVSGQGVLYFSSATDTGNAHSGKSGCWEGDFNGSNPPYLNFVNGGQTNKIISSGTTGVTVTLFWSEPAGGATSQYDLFEYDASGNPVHQAQDRVSATGRPSQTLYNVLPGHTIAVYLESGSARFLHLDIFEGNATFNYATNGRTRGHNASGAANAFCVAASPAGAATGGGPAGPYPAQFSSSNGIETFSADGPRRIFFNTNGTAITPGNLSSTGGQLLAKPDFAAADGVTTSLPAGALNLFYGTSASAPHAGALAALMLSYDAALTPAQMGVVLRAGTVKPASSTLNANDYGAGILLAPSMVAAASTYSGGPTISGFFPTSGPVGTSVTIYGYNFTNPFSVVFNGNVAATVTSSSISQVVVTVPAGALTGPIRITNSTGGSVYTPMDFTVTTVQKPVISSATSVNGQVGKAFSYTITASNSPTGYDAIGLPPGLSINKNNGLISGTPTAAGTYSFTIKATNNGGTDSETLTINILPAAPVITSDLTANGKVGTPFSYQIVATNNPPSYGAAGLKVGLHINGSTGVISGTPTAAGTFNVTIKATNKGGTDSETLTINILPAAPVITSNLSVSGKVGVAFSYQITATNTPTSYGAVGLKAGLHIDGGTGVISGTPTAAGTFNVTIKAANSSGVDAETLTVNILNAQPVITSAASATGQVGVPFAYQITATNSPTNYGAVGLKYGLTITASNGLISGTPTTAGTFTFTLKAANNGGVGTKDLTVTIKPPAAPVISAASAYGTVNVAFSSYQVAATGKPTSYAATGLPAGLNLNATTGVISGTPTQAGTFTVHLSATNAYGTGTGTLTLKIAPQNTPVIVSALTATGDVGTLFNYQIAATRNPSSYGATGLPPGLAIGNTPGLITGTPTTAGTYSVTLTASNSVGTGSALLTITIQKSGVPLITSTLTAVGSVGSAFSYQIAASNNPTGYGAGGLPGGLTVSAKGLVSGTPTTAGRYTVTLQATNTVGTGSAALALTIQPQGSPVIYSASTATGTVGNDFSYTILADPAATSFTASDLPPGLSVNTSTGKITGTPTQAGSFAVALTATNASGKGSKTVTIKITSVPPVITSNKFATAMVNKAFTYQITADGSPTSFNATGLPAGLNINKTTGVISGTPTVAGEFSVTISATNGGGTGSATLDLTVEGTPVIDNHAPPTATVGQSFTYYIYASNEPTSYNATGLPPGLTIDKTYGEITGKPTKAGTYTVTLNATNTAGTGTGSITITVQGLNIPVVTAKDFGTLTTGQSVYYYIDATNNPTSYNATGLPAGLTIDKTYGEITGKPTAAGTFTVTLYATNASGTGSVQVTVVVNALQKPVVTAKDFGTAITNTSFFYYIDATNNPTSYNATGLPAGLSVDTSDGDITGKPTQAGTFPITLSATNAAGTGTVQVTLTVQAQSPPVVTAKAANSATVGQSFFYYIDATNNPTSYNASGLPPGLTIDTSGGTISGKPTTAGTYTVTLSASNAAGTGSAQITITVQSLNPPVVDNTPPGNATVGSYFTYYISASNNPTSYSASGVPPGLSVDATGGSIYGTPTTAGTYPVTIYASNGAGTGSASITITVNPN